MKKEKIIFFSIFAVIVILFLVTGKTAFFLAACAFFFYVLFALALLLFGGRKLEAGIRLENEAQKSEAKEAQLLLENRSVFPVFRCDAELCMENLLTGAKRTEQVACGVFSRSTKDVRFFLSDECCGILKAQIVKIRTADPLRLFSKKADITQTADEMMILPLLSKDEINKDQVEQYDMESFRYADGRIGSDSSETVGIKSYEPGDSVKAIHWKLSAKTGETVIKEYGLPVDARLMVLADKCSPEHKTAAEMDRLTEYALSFSLSLMEADIPHSFGWYDVQEERFVCEDVRSDHDLYMLLPGFLKAPFYEDNEGCCLRFLDSGQDKNYAGYFYITFEEQQEAEGLELLRGYANVTVLSPERIEQNTDLDR